MFFLVVGLLVLSFSVYSLQESLLYKRRDWWVQLQQQGLKNVVLPIATSTCFSTSAGAVQETGVSKEQELLQSRLAETVIVQQQQQPCAFLKTPTTYPSWLDGTWDVTKTLVGCTAPLGVRFLGGPNGDASIGSVRLAEAQARLDKPVRLPLRYAAQDDSSIVAGLI